MRIRHYFVLLLLISAVGPLLAFGYVSLTKSQETTTQEIRRANQLLAQSTAARISDYLKHEVKVLEAAGMAITLAKPAEAQRIAESYSIDFTHWHNLTVMNSSGDVRAAAPTVGYLPPAIDTDAALSGTPTMSKVRAARNDRDGPFAHGISLATPLYIVGSLRGAVLVDMDLIDIWGPVNAIKVGEHGFVRLMTSDGIILAHGHPEDRRDVFAGQQRSDILAHAKRGEDIINTLGEPSITALAAVEGTDWFVIIEQPVSEAYAPALALRIYLIALIGATAILAIGIGLWAGRRFVQSLERMESHTKTIASGNLSSSVSIPSAIREVKSLASSINTMATSLDALHEEARNKERITTFGRVAAGLAHDLRQPIETIQVACTEYLGDSDSEQSMEFFRWAVENEMPRLQRYLDDLQHLATKGDVGLHPESLYPKSLVEDLLTSLSGTPKWEGVEFIVTGDAKSIDADKNLLSRALQNLAANGADATLRDDGGTVTIEVSDIKSPTGSALQFRISDTGCGMSPQALADVLHGDFQSTKRANGVGLGFGVARHIVQSHGGTLEGFSSEGKGTTFTLQIPREKSPHMSSKNEGTFAES